MIGGMTSLPDLDQLTPAQLRALVEQTPTLQSQVEAMKRKIQNDKIIIEQLTHEIAVLKRHKYAKRSEEISPEQGHLLDDLLSTDLEAIEAELNALHPDPVPKPPRKGRTCWPVSAGHVVLLVRTHSRVNPLLHRSLFPSVLGKQR